MNSDGNPVLTDGASRFKSSHENPSSAPSKLKDSGP